MKFSWNVFFQTIGTAIQVANASGVIPPKYQSLVAAVTGLMQGGVALKAHNSNPDGTPARSAAAPAPSPASPAN